MTRKILTGVICVSLIVMVVCAGLVLGVMYDYMGNKIDERLAAEACLVEAALRTAGDEYLEVLGTLDQEKKLNNRITLISSEGEVFYDSKADYASMENHMEREEIREALTEGEGYASRTSFTMAEDTRYYAKLTSDGSIIRVSANHLSQLGLLLDTMGVMVVITVILLMLSLFISYRVATAITMPINHIDLDNPDIAGTYEELRPLVHRIHHQNIKIRKQMESLSKRTEEFNIITENMSEGLIILDKEGTVLSYNRSALQMLGNEEIISIGKKLGFDGENPLSQAVSTALEGSDCRAYIESEESTCEFLCSSVKAENTVTGVVVIVLDVTEQEKGEKLRREFTSNVSHELKTPLTSIFGISDMLASGMVKAEDVQSFAASIKEESSRLISLIEDIINLSRLDESSVPKEMEDIDMAAVAENVAARLSSKAGEQDIEIICDVESAVIRGTGYMADEIIFNLVENAIKYNKPGGKVKVSVANVGGECILRVEDTGIGISAADQQRVFERFFRADKSHSKKIGGTGLGLSIVKHAAAYLGGVITLESEEGKGTTIIINFPAVPSPYA